MGRKILRKGLSIFLCIFMVLGSEVAAFAVEGKQSENGLTGSAMETKIKGWITKGYITKDKNGEFKPEEIIKRYEVASLINRTFGYTQKANGNYKDVRKNDPFFSDMSIAKKAGYFLISKDGRVSPKEVYTKEDLAYALFKVMKFEKPKKLTAVSKLKDRKSIDGEAVYAVETILEKGILAEQTPGVFSPGKPMTKAETLTALDKCLEIVIATYGKKGTYSPGIIAGSIRLDVADVEIENSTIKGDLVIGEGVGEGNIKLKNVTVLGNTIVRGGGMNSIVIENCKMSHIVVQKVGNMVRVVAVGETTAERVDMQSGGKLEESGLSGGGFKEVVLSEEIDTGAPVSLVGDFGTVEIQGDGLGVNLSGGTVESLTVSGTAQNTAVNLGNNAVVSNMEIGASTSVAGAGKVASATVTNPNVSLELSGGTSVSSLGISTEAKGSTVDLGGGTTVSALHVDSSATISGTGKIGTAVVSTGDVKITAPTTEIKHTVAGTTGGNTTGNTTTGGTTTGGTTAGGTTAGGTSTGGTSGGSTGGSTGGGGGGGGGTSDRQNNTITITGTLAISGESKVGSVLTAEGFLPANALVNYQWKRSDSETGTYTDIIGANQKTYCPVTADANKYLKVTVTGKTGYNGTMTSKEIGPILLRSIKVYTAPVITQTGDVANKNVQYSTSAEALAALPKVISVTLEDGISLANVPLVWGDTDHYNSGVPGEYSFSATWGTFPPGVDNDDNIAPPVIKLKVEAGMIQLYRKASGTGMPTSEVKLKINGAFIENYDIYFDGILLATSKNGIVVVGTELLKDLSRIEILHDGIKKKTTETLGSW